MNNLNLALIIIVQYTVICVCYGLALFFFYRVLCDASDYVDYCTGYDKYLPKEVKGDKYLPEGDWYAWRLIRRGLLNATLIGLLITVALNIPTGVYDYV